MATKPHETRMKQHEHEKKKHGKNAAQTVTGVGNLG